MIAESASSAHWMLVCLQRAPVGLGFTLVKSELFSELPLKFRHYALAT